MGLLFWTACAWCHRFRNSTLQRSLSEETTKGLSSGRLLLQEYRGILHRLVAGFGDQSSAWLWSSSDFIGRGSKGVQVTHAVVEVRLSVSKVSWVQNAGAIGFSPRSEKRHPLCAFLPPPSFVAQKVIVVCDQAAEAIAPSLWNSLFFSSVGNCVRVETYLLRL